MSPSSPLIAITGINGFIATEVVLLFLSHEWHVRGSVRTSTQAEKLKSLPAYEKYFASGKLEVVVVEDLAKADFSELLEGADAVASVAAPLPKMDNPSLEWDKDFKGPTIDPVLRILEYAKKSTTIKSVAVMSSSGSCFTLTPPPGKVYTEADWTPYTEELCHNPATPIIWYFTAKKLAEQAVLKFQETEKPAFSIATFAPSMVYGPPRFISSIDDARKGVQGSSDEVLSLFVGKDQPLPHQFARAYADVRDVADAFYAAITKNVSGKFLLSGHEYKWQAFADKLREIRPDLDAYIPLGTPGQYIPDEYFADASKSQRELGIKYRTTEETLKDTIDFYENLGLFKEAPLGPKKKAFI
ncbi:hypothetical protein I350_03853 [Cryptococcus amylolentus CBS 6273]|uniref:NAD-dependent epimerase/dehydratase domain-containing protein n=1 Tax=Cryptococcus amylolentus CBS 6273 TaxID=1296118 RepID=A0A1E3K5X2_9TREE|nr:hypothetical protein I350_03853 [Cryptococcus amylolentus CBS 6273]